MLIGFISGLIGFILGSAIFYAGYRMGQKMNLPPPPAAPAHITTEAEEAELEKMRDRLREEQEAFHTLLNYNKDIAYGQYPDRKLGT